MIIIREQVFWLAGNTAIRLPGADKTPVTVLNRVSCLQLRDSTGVAPVSLLPGVCRHSRNTDMIYFFILAQADEKDKRLPCAE